ncbi:DMT family transporter [Parasphingorhabdus sp. JC815]|uniref:DMT family transporter n=1 Tax=Parasphingorhabdus sp. JC815 TaxID=3232140 RepID=UPI003459D194
MALSRTVGSAGMFLPQLALLSAAALWGGGFFVTKLGLDYSGPFAIVALRFGAAALFLGILLRGSLLRLTRREQVGGFFVALFGAFGSVSVAYALKTEPSARVVFLAALYVPLVPLLHWSLFKRNPGRNIWAGVALAITGVGVMAGIANTTATLSTGDGFALASAGFIAMQVIVLGQFSQGVNTMALAWTTLLFTSLVAGLSSFLIGEPMPQLNQPVLFWIIIGFGISTAYIQFAMGWGQARVDASKASLIYATEPVFGGVIGWLAGETLGVADITGGLLIVTGFIIGAMPNSQHPFRFRAARNWFTIRFGAVRQTGEQFNDLP